MDEPVVRRLGAATLPGQLRLELLDGFGLTEEFANVALPLGSQRLVAFLAPVSYTHLTLPTILRV